MNEFNDKGLKEGYWEVYSSNGNIWSNGNYINDKCMGYWEDYYFNGNLFRKGEYYYDEYIGYWEWYNSGGKLEFKEFYL